MNNVSVIGIAVPNTRDSSHGKKGHEKKVIDSLLISPSFYGTFVFIATRSPTNGTSLLRSKIRTIQFHYSHERGVWHFSGSFIGSATTDCVVVDVSCDDAVLKIEDFCRRAHGRPQLSSESYEVYNTIVDMEKEHSQKRKNEIHSRSRKRAALRKEILE